MDVKYPGHDNLVSHICEECIGYKQAFKGKHWQYVTLEMLMNGSYTTLCFFTKEAYHFYLPAFMIIAIDHWGEAAVMPDNVIYEFDIKGYNADADQKQRKVDAWAVERNTGFSRGQQAAIFAFLGYMAEEHGEDYFPDNPKLDYVNKAIRSVTKLWGE